MLEDINNTYRIRSSCAVYNISIHPNNSVLFHYLIPLCSGAERLSAALALSLYYCQARGPDHVQVNSRRLQGLKKLSAILKSLGLDQ